MTLSGELEPGLREFFNGGPVEVRENGKRLASLGSLSWEIRNSGEKILLHIWSEQLNLTRRILAITQHSPERVALAIECFGRSKPGRLEFVRAHFQRTPRELSREEFCNRLCGSLAEQFPDESLESLIISPDLEHSLSGNYARGLLSRGSTYTALLAVPGDASPDDVGNSLTFAILWFDRSRYSAHGGAVSSLRLILPKGTSSGIAQRLGALDPRLPIQLYERDPDRETILRVDPNALSNISAWLVPHRETQALLDRARSALDPIVALAPQAIALHAAVPSREVFLSFRGLPFVRWNDGRVFFGTSEPRQELTPDAHRLLKRLLHDLKAHRQPLASDTRHLLYRTRAERWLESLVREDVTRIDAKLDPRFVYSQVFADAGGEHGILDLLATTRTGRLAILELKATEHIHLPLQAADYWLRVRRHLQQGDFTRCGYFPGVQLQAATPLVYLVAPALHFHPATDTLLRYLSPELDVTRVGLAEGWRRGLRVVMRQ